ncbi:MAG: hypothetical protein RL220_1839 [Bacteroidota bacterium]
MKRIASLCAFFAVIPFFSNATVWTVSNNIDRPAQFTTVQQAIDAASPNDTILITGGTYDGGTSVKPLVYYGEAIEGSQFPVTTINNFTLGRFNSSLSSSGSRCYGIVFSNVTLNSGFGGASAGQQTLSDMIFERCIISNYSNQTGGNVGDDISNVTFRNCLFPGGTFYFTYFPWNPGIIENITITNCVIQGTSFYSNIYGQLYDFNGNILFRNNVFINRPTQTFYAIQEAVLENNIFYAAEPTGLSVSTFNNNITYLCNSNTIPYGDNLGSGNIVNADPLFINYPQLGGPHSWSYDYGLQAGSPADATGTNGTDIGLTGGNAPVNNLPKYAKIPGVTSLSIPVSSVPVGGTLQINIEAESRD